MNKDELYHNICLINNIKITPSVYNLKKKT